MRSGTAIPPLLSLLRRAASPGAGSAVVLTAANEGLPFATATLGTTRAFDAPGRPAPVPGPIVTIDTIFDLASVTKPLVAAAILTELESRGLDPSLCVAEVVPEFREPGLGNVTVRHLLSHTAGFAPSWPDRSADPRAARFRAHARPVRRAGFAHEYSCANYIWAGLFLEGLTGSPLRHVVAERVFHPLEMEHTGFSPPPAQRDLIAATEFQRGRGMVQGEVHDETAHALGGEVGNAGVFGTAPDLLRFAEALRTGRGLRPLVHAWLTEPIAIPNGPAYGQTLGLRRDEAWCA